MQDIQSDYDLSQKIDINMTEVINKGTTQEEIIKCIKSIHGVLGVTAKRCFNGYEISLQSSVYYSKKNLKEFMQELNYKINNLVMFREY